MALEGKRALQLDLRNNASLTHLHKLQFDENYRQTLCCKLLFTGEKKKNSVRYRNSIWDNLAGCLGSLWCAQDSMTMTDNLGNNWARPFVYLHLPLHLCHVFHLGIDFALEKLKWFLTQKRSLLGFSWTCFSCSLPPLLLPSLPAVSLPSTWGVSVLSARCKMIKPVQFPKLNLSLISTS